MILFLLFVTCFSIKSNGAWILTYLDNPSICTGKTLAFRMLPKCFVMQEYTSSFHYTCDNEWPNNVTVDLYHSDDCESEGHPTFKSVHLANSNVCSSGTKYQCLGDFKVDYPYAEVQVPLNISDPKIGTPINPAVGSYYVPMLNCEMMPSVKAIYWTIECDFATQNAKMKVYDKSDCSSTPFSEIDLSPNTVYDFGKIAKTPEMPHLYQKFVGCKTP